MKEVREDNGAERYDTGKAPMHLLPPDAVMELVKVYQEGAKKYAPRNWERGMDWSRCYDSLLRHAFAWLKGEDLDTETGCQHMAHAAWNALALVAYSLREIGLDDRHRAISAHVKTDPVLAELGRIYKIDPEVVVREDLNFGKAVHASATENERAACSVIKDDETVVGQVIPKELKIRGLTIRTGSKIRFFPNDDIWEVVDIYPQPDAPERSMLVVKDSKGFRKIEMIAGNFHSLVG